VSAEDQRRLVLVVGVGRSGTSLLAGILGQAGFHIPQPEVQADDTNPRGFGEPRWVVDFHTKLMRKTRVTVFDARPAAWEGTATVAAEDGVEAELRDWVASQLAEADAVVVKDPRIGWFLPLWERCSGALGVTPSFVTMLRHPGEILTSARKSYGTWQTDASRAASWLNVMLETEHATRGARRVFVRYEDLLGGWNGQITRIGDALDLPLIHGLSPERAAEIDRFVDPALHRNRGAWDGLDVPARVRDLADEVWAQLELLADPAADTTAVAANLDAARARYAELYGEAEAIAQSSVTAVRPRRAQGAESEAAGSPAPTPLTALKIAVARRLPPRARKRVRRALRLISRS
jgi:hypothetical protein